MPPPPLAGLPTEIVETIATYLDRRRITHCLRVCTPWYAHFIRILYAQVYLTRPPRLRHLVELAKASSRLQRAFVHVTTLSLDWDSDDDYIDGIEASAADLISSCPRLQVLEIPCNEAVLDTLVLKLAWGGFNASG